MSNKNFDKETVKLNDYYFRYDAKANAIKIRI